MPILRWTQSIWEFLRTRKLSEHGNRRSWRHSSRKSQVPIGEKPTAFIPVLSLNYTLTFRRLNVPVSLEACKALLVAINHRGQEGFHPGIHEDRDLFSYPVGPGQHTTRPDGASDLGDYYVTLLCIFCDETTLSRSC